MTRGLDDLTLTFYETKLRDHDEDDKNVKHLCLLVTKISFLNLFKCGVKITLDLPYIRVQSQKFPRY